jgi:hypothetical protein
MDGWMDGWDKNKIGSYHKVKASKKENFGGDIKF